MLISVYNVLDTSFFTNWYFWSLCLRFVFPGVCAKLCDTAHNWSKTTSKEIAYNVYTNWWLASQNQVSIKYYCYCDWLGSTPEGKWGEKGLGLRILNLGNRSTFTPRPLYPGRRFWEPIAKEAVWTWEPAWKIRKKSVTCAGNGTMILRLSSQ